LRDYYADTTVAFTVARNSNQDASVVDVASKYRFQAVTYGEQEALRALINATYVCTLPKAWEAMPQAGSFAYLLPKK
jgi:hypothetical protein